MNRSRSLAVKCLLGWVLVLPVRVSSAESPNSAVLKSEKIFVTNDSGYSVTVYPTGKFGNLRPLLTYSNSDALLGCPPDGAVLEHPSSIALDGTGNIYVANDGSWHRGYDSVTIFGKGKSPTDPPISAIRASGTTDKTGFASLRGIAVDGKEYVYVINFGTIGDPSITIYPPGSNGNIAPVRTITGAATGLSQPAGVAIDSARFIYAVNTDGGPVAPGGSITIYAPDAEGNATPVRVISGTSGSNLTDLDAPSAIALDPAGNIYVANNGSTDGMGGADSVTIYATNSSGNVKPMARISGRLWSTDEATGSKRDRSRRNREYLHRQ